MRRLQSSGGHVQTQRQPRRSGQRGADPGDARGPSVTLVQPTENRRAGKTAEEVAREIKPARRAAIAGRGAPDEAGRGGLREEGAVTDEREAGEDERQARRQHERQPAGGEPERTPEGPPRAIARDRASGERRG